MDKLKISFQFEQYLKIVKLDAATMPADQYREIRRGFYGGWGQLIMLMSDDIPALPEAKGVQILEAMTKEVAAFWLSEAKNQLG